MNIDEFIKLANDYVSNPSYERLTRLCDTTYFTQYPCNYIPGVFRTSKLITFGCRRCPMLMPANSKYHGTWCVFHAAFSAEIYNMYQGQFLISIVQLLAILELTRTQVTGVPHE